MSEQYPGGVLSKTAPVPTGPYESGTAPGLWTLSQQAAYKQQGIWPTAGLRANYIEDVFSTYLYTGTNTNPNTITNGIDLSTKGGMVWCKARSAANSNTVWDTARGVKNFLITNATNANTNLTSSYPTYGLQSFNTNGFTLGRNYEGENDTGDSIVSWTFRKQPKFFDVVTYTGNNTGQAIAHSLGSAPGTIIVKCTTAVTNWVVYHRSLGSSQFIQLSTDGAAISSTAVWGGVDPTSTQFTVGTSGSCNASGNTYIAYLFAHDAGGFGLTGTDNVISCGSYVGTGSGSVSVTLGYEPQYLLIKQATGATLKNWWVIDNMRGIPVGSNDAILAANLSDAEVSADLVSPTATGFEATNTAQSNLSGVTYIYIAIRRGPMKVPTDGTKVYTNVLQTSANPATLTTGFPVDLLIQTYNSGNAKSFSDRLRGSTTTSYRYLQSTNTNAEASGSGGGIGFDNNTGIVNNLFEPYPLGYTTESSWSFRRAPSFFDEVVLNSSTTTYTHNLTVAPELIFVKCRDAGGANWVVYSKSISSPTTQYLNLNNTNAEQTYGTGAWSSSSTQFSVNTGLWANGSSGVAYLFATCAGVSKVGSYTGNGSTQAIACGFTGGARFVLIKRTDSTGDWYVYDTARGMSTLTNPYLLLNNTAAESATLGSVTTTTGGFTVNASILAAINTNAATYIFLAIA